MVPMFLNPSEMPARDVEVDRTEVEAKPGGRRRLALGDDLARSQAERR